MANPLYHYDPKGIVITFGEILIEGFADDSFCSIEPAGDDATLYVGADGSATRGMTNNNSATITVTLSQSSPTNALLSAMSKVDRTTGQGVRPMLVKDINGADLHLAPKCWIKKRPGREYGNAVKTRAWVFETHDLQDFDGGALAPPLPSA